jgi:thiol-disulfide isomerase/thioredoxin
VIPSWEKSVAVIRHLLAATLLLGALPAQAAGAESLFATTLSGVDDKPAAMSRYQGMPLIVNFWARWCAPCRTEIPELAKVQGKFQKQGLVVLGIGLEDQSDAVRDFMKAYEMNYPVVLAKDNAKRIWLMQALGNTQAGLPFTIAINRQGEIVMRKLGVMKAADIEAAALAALK